NLQRPVIAVFFDPYTSVISIPVSEQKADERPKRSVPVFTFPENAVAAIAAAVRYGTWRKSPTGSLVELSIDRDQVQRVILTNQTGGWLSQESAAQLLGAAGIITSQSPDRAGIEVRAGITHDPVFGPLVGFGSGGALLDLLDDVAYRVLPLT